MSPGEALLSGVPGGSGALPQFESCYSIDPTEDETVGWHHRLDGHEF